MLTKIEKLALTPCPNLLSGFRTDMPLSELPVGQAAFISHTIHHALAPGLGERLAALGFINGRRVEVLRQAVWGGPMHVRVGFSTEIAIRRQEAATIILKPGPTGEGA